jgi:hypothetical protein
VIEAELPEEPVAEESGDPQSAVAVQSQSEFVDETQPTAAERAFGLFDAGKIGELALLAAVGVSRDGYVPSETITHRALDAVEQDKLSEEALIKIIG